MRRIGLVAHDQMKPAIVAWAGRYEAFLREQMLYATGTTGRLLRDSYPALDITLLKSGPHGGDQQLGALIAEGKLDGLIFFSDPLSAMPHDVDVKALLRLSTLYNIPIACNEATADMIMAAWGSAESSDALGSRGQKR